MFPEPRRNPGLMTLEGLSENALSRVAADWKTIAGEPVTVEQLSGAVYGFCSELGTLRLLAKYRWNEKAGQGFSKPRQSFYFRLEL